MTTGVVRLQVGQTGSLQERNVILFAEVGLREWRAVRGAEHEVLRIPASGMLQALDGLIDVVLPQRCDSACGERYTSSRSWGLRYAEPLFAAHILHGGGDPYLALVEV